MPARRKGTDMNDIKSYQRITKSLAQLVSLTGLYKFDHPIVREKIIQTYNEINNQINVSGKSFIMAKTGDVFFVNGEKMDTGERMLRRFVEGFVTLQLGSVEFAHGLTLAEFEAYMLVASRKEKLEGADKIKAFLKDRGVSNIIARAASFKLVQEDEDIIKKGGVIKIDQLPPETVKRFAEDLLSGKVSAQIKSSGKDYKAAAHSPEIVAGLAFDMVKDGNDPGVLEKVLWSVADYLMGEISTSREEDANRRVLDEIKDGLISRFKDKKDRSVWEGATRKTFAVIDTALQLKGLVSLYSRHKKDTESAFKKIKEIMSTLPAESEMCKNTKDELARTGAPVVDFGALR